MKNLKKFVFYSNVDKSPSRIPSRFLLENGYNISKIEK